MDKVYLVEWFSDSGERIGKQLHWGTAKGANERGKSRLGDMSHLPWYDCVPGMIKEATTYTVKLDGYSSGGFRSTMGECDECNKEDRIIAFEDSDYGESRICLSCAQKLVKGE